MGTLKTGQRLIQWFLLALNCGYKELARLAKVSETTVGNWVLGKKEPRRSNLERLAGQVPLPLALIESIVLPGLETLRLGKNAEDEVNQELAAVARDLDTCRAGLSRAAVASVVARLEERPAVEQEAVAPLWARLETLSNEELDYVAENLPDLRRRDLAEVVMWASVKAAAVDAGRALALARVAHRLAVLLKKEGHAGPGLEGLAVAHVGNVHRVTNDAEEAERSFARALKLWGAASPAERAGLPGWRLLDLEGSHRRDQGRFPEALARLEEAKAAAPPAAWARILVNRAATLEYMGNPEGAIEALEEALPLANAAAEPRLVWSIQVNYGANLCHLSRLGEAEQLLPSIAELARLGGVTEGLAEIRMVWLRARIASGLGRWAEARAGFDRARSEYETHKMAANYAVVSLERAVLDLKEGRYPEVKALAEEMSWIFNAKGLHAGVLAALTLFRTAARREALTLDVAERMVKYLYRAPYDPKLKFGG